MEFLLVDGCYLNTRQIVQINPIPPGNNTYIVIYKRAGGSEGRYETQTGEAPAVAEYLAAHAVKTPYQPGIF